VLKEYGAVSRIESFNGQGTLIRTQTRTEWKNLGSITMPVVFTVEDHRTGSKSVMRLLDCEVNQGIPDSEFTRRALMRGD
jgi:hypothetical protein